MFYLDFTTGSGPSDIPQPDSPLWHILERVPPPVEDLVGLNGEPTLLTTHSLVREWLGTNEEFTALWPGGSAVGQFVAHRREGDRLCYFDAGGWQSLSGRAGYVILRQNRVAHSYITRMS